MVEHDLAVGVGHDLSLEAYGLSGRKLVGDECRHALCPWGPVYLGERDGAGVALDEIEILRMRFVSCGISFFFASEPQIEVERCPADAVGGIAVQIEYGICHGASWDGGVLCAVCYEIVGLGYS